MAVPRGATVRELKQGSRIAWYEIERPIAIGGMATVFEARHAILPRRVAIKVMHAKLLETPGSVDRMFQEACILESLAHPSTVRIHDCGVLPDRRPWLAMELVAGTVLSDRLTEVHRMSFDDVVDLIAGVAEVLAVAHRMDLVHRDLKPDNIICLGDGALPLKVIDWGIARAVREGGPRLTLENATAGTPIYMAPEQARGQDVDGKCDVYALGVLAYEALCGAPPFTGANALEVIAQHLGRDPDPISEHRPDISDELASLVEMMLIKDRDFRPTAEQVLRWVELMRDGRAGAIDEQPYDEVTISDDDVVLLDRPVLGHGRWRTPIVPRGQRDAVSGELDLTAS
jgi:serine/threonine-protein kinase